MDHARFEYVQPIVLLVERDEPAPAVDGIRAAAVASVRAYQRDLGSMLMPPEWEIWLDGPFAKTVRRADRNAFDKVLAATNPDDRTYVTCGRAEAIAFRPVLATEMPKLLSRLQVSGTSLPSDATSAAPSAAGPVVTLNAGLGMSTGKAAAQAAHALFLWYLNLEPESPGTVDCEIRFADATEFALLLFSSDSTAVITDAGRTEIEPGTITAFADRLYDSGEIEAQFPQSNSG